MKINNYGRQSSENMFKRVKDVFSLDIVSTIKVKNKFFLFLSFREYGKLLNVREKTGNFEVNEMWQLPWIIGRENENLIKPQFQN